ncbi:hypothetical protein [Methanolapillus africanus]|uniref:hypothetical protein n=1 Tax=Methanolapillus africanus TaxID=3028297 RepID=UPI0030B89CD5
MTEDIYKWISKKYGTEPYVIREILKDETVFSFLMIWTIFEQKLFDGSFKRSSIETFIDRRLQQINVANFESIVEHFHERYQNISLYAHLKKDESYIPVDRII